MYPPKMRQNIGSFALSTLLHALQWQKAAFGEAPENGKPPETNS